jgi:hypothetical protein
LKNTRLWMAEGVLPSAMNRCIAYSLFPELFPLTVVNPCVFASFSDDNKVSYRGMAHAILYEIAEFVVVCLLVVLGVIMYDKIRHQKNA